MALATLAVVTASAAGSLASVAPADAAPENLVTNPSLEAGAAWPDCFSPSGWGTEAAWSATPGRLGGRAISITIDEYESGDRKLLQTETDACAPSVEESVDYSLGVWYQSTAPVHLTAFRHGPGGWSYWGDFGEFSASADWSLAESATPPLPAGTDRLVFGLSLAASGTLTTDDYSLIGGDEPTDPPSDPPSNLVVNPALVDGTWYWRSDGQLVAIR